MSYSSDIWVSLKFLERNRIVESTSLDNIKLFFKVDGSVHITMGRGLYPYVPFIPYPHQNLKYPI